MGQTAVLRRPPCLPARPAAIPFPTLPGSVRRLRRWRDRCFREGRLDLALQAAREVARRDPGRESLLKLGFLLREKGLYRQALEALRRALLFHRGPRYLVPEIYLHLAHTWFLRGRRKRMLWALRKARDCRPRPRSDGKFFLLYGNDLFGRGRYREAAEMYAEAEGFARRALERGRAAINGGLALLRLGEREEAARRLGRAIRILRRAGHAAELAEARMAMAGVRFDQGQFRRALGMFTRAAEAFRRCGKADREAQALVNAAYSAAQIGRWEWNIIDRSLRLSVKLGRYDLAVVSFACRSLARAHAGDWSGALNDLERSREALRRGRSWIGVLHFCRAQARMAALRGDWESVRRAARRAERVAARAGDDLRVIEFRRMRALAEEKLGRPRASAYARRTAERLAALHRRNGSSRLWEAERLAAHLGPSDLTVLIVGDDPRGRLELARKIHDSGPRGRGPFVVAPCEQLVFPAAEILGHEGGMWTGAGRPDPGYAGRARRGTLVLDRVDELAPEDQRILVPLLDGKIRPVGGTSEARREARILATCRDPRRLVPDLRQRLSGAVLRLPDLRGDGREAARILERSLHGRRLAPDAVEELSRHPWEGGAAEVRAAAERLETSRAAVIGRGTVRKILAVTGSCRAGGRVHKKRHSLQTAFTPS